MSDLINRQQAIDAVKELCLHYTPTKSVKHPHIDFVVEELELLPSAQPERPEQPESAKEYCAECNHIEMCRWYPYEGCEFRSLPSAQPERKKGKWLDGKGNVKIVGYGAYCSCCKRESEYVTNYCPNCGADMRGESDEMQ